MMSLIIINICGGHRVTLGINAKKDATQSQFKNKILTNFLKNF